jgi:hypothetical protein
MIETHDSRVVEAEKHVARQTAARRGLLNFHAERFAAFKMPEATQ